MRRWQVRLLTPDHRLAKPGQAAVGKHLAPQPILRVYARAYFLCPLLRPFIACHAEYWFDIFNDGTPVSEGQGPIPKALSRLNADAPLLAQGSEVICWDGLRTSAEARSSKPGAHVNAFLIQQEPAKAPTPVLAPFPLLPGLADPFLQMLLGPVIAFTNLMGLSPGGFKRRGRLRAFIVRLKKGKTKRWVV